MALRQQEQVRLAFLFDLDGTLFRQRLSACARVARGATDKDIDLPVWRIHRQIGMSGGLMLNALFSRDRAKHHAGGGRLESHPVPGAKG